MRVSARAEVRGASEWLVWSDGRTYASLGPVASSIEALVGPGVPLRDAIPTADDAERLFAAAFQRLRAEPRIIRED